ncbi:MAG: O-antigen ligase family protein [Pseudomonadota bacterium]
MRISITQSTETDLRIPGWMLWVQCIAFAVLYAVWILPEIVGFRNTALVTGAIFGSYSIYRYRELFLQRYAVPIWLIIGLFSWATFHLFFISANFSLQRIEYFRIWKYAALGAIMATGLGLSLVNSSTQKSKYYWNAVYLGLCAPVIIYLIKYLFSTYGLALGLDVPLSLRIYNGPLPFYVPKTDYVAFCLPAFSVALGLLLRLSRVSVRWHYKEYLNLAIQMAVIAATLFLFIAQNIKNGIAYAAMLFIVFGVLLFLGKDSVFSWKKLMAVLLIFSVLIVAVVVNVQKNNSWTTLLADTKIAVQLDKYPHWKDANKYGYPQNEYGTIVSITNYERAAWAYVGLKLSLENPLGYGLIEDSFAKMAKARWPDVGSNLSHSHSGWLDVILAIGYPGFLLIILAMLLTIKNAFSIKPPWATLAFWPLLASLLLWCTTEVSATVTFAALIFWICLGGGLCLRAGNGTLIQSRILDLKKKLNER